METTIARDGTRITYRRSGEGPPLILVHETAANHGRWSPVLPALEERFTVYAMDRRGRGGSGDGHGYAIEREFEDAAAVLDSTGGPVNLLGHSCGALIAGSGYYHGTMEAIVTKIGPDKVLEEADTLCAGLYSFDHYNCAHGLSHGFMRVQENELFESLEMCDVLTDSWEEKRCYSGVFMENVVDKDNLVHPSKYLKTDRPLYPCDMVGDRYKDECYQKQSSYALETRGNDFAKGFDLCAKVEDDFRPSCYQGLGRDTSVQSLKQGTSDSSINEATRSLCALGKDQVAQFNCAAEAVNYFIRDSYSDARAKAFCEHFGPDLCAMCLQEAEEYYRSLRSPLERRET